MDAYLKLRVRHGGAYLNSIDSRFPLQERFALIGGWACSMMADCRGEDSTISGSTKYRHVMAVVCSAPSTLGEPVKDRVSAPSLSGSLPPIRKVRWVRVRHLYLQLHLQVPIYP